MTVGSDEPLGDGVQHSIIQLSLLYTSLKEQGIAPAISAHCRLHSEPKTTAFSDRGQSWDQGCT